MPDYVEPTVLESFLRGGAPLFIPAFFSVLCAVWLIVARVRSFRGALTANSVRDLALLAAGPVSAILFALTRASGVAQSYVRGGLDSEFPFLLGLTEIAIMATIAFFSFAVGVVACALPSKPMNPSPDPAQQ